MSLQNIPITITRKKIKNMYLRIHPDGTITVSAPLRLSNKAIQDFINSKSDWIMKQRENLLARQSVAKELPRELSYISGETHFLWGHPCRLLVEEVSGKYGARFVENRQYEKTMAAEEEAGQAWSGTSTLEGTGQGGRETGCFGTILLRVPKNSTTEERWKLLEEFYRTQLKAAIPSIMEKYSAIVGKVPAEWRIRNMKTKWGTCNVVDKRIWLALNLAKKDPQCLEYVIAHELTHLHEPNHGKAFWARMDLYFPEWREVRKRLNEG